MTTQSISKSVGRSFLVIQLLLTCVVFSPSVKAGGCYLEPACTGATHVYHDNILGDSAGFHDDTSAGCLALNNAQIQSCDGGPSGDFSFHYFGPVMSYDTAFGSHALYSNGAGGDYNSAFGAAALYSNSSGSSNTAIGYEALFHNANGGQNTASGFEALLNNTTGSHNTATGYEALLHNTNAVFNTATGYAALFSNSHGGENTATGFAALNNNLNGSDNTADGSQALLSTTGSSNVGIGAGAGGALTSGSGNVCIGADVPGVAGESNTTRIRNIYASLVSGRAVYVDSHNKIGTLASTRRVKQNIKPMDRASEAILALKPVSFRYKKEIDASGTSQFGLIAEQVAETDPDLVTRDAEGKPETVRYDAVNAMLLNEFLKARRQIDVQQKQIEALTAGLQKVSVQLELSKSAPQTVLNDQ